jgi:carboxyl-terminal processing protease
MRILFVLVLFLAACGGPSFTMGSGSGDLKEGYNLQVSLNPELVCTPHMAQDVWTAIRDDYYKPVSNKQIFSGAITGLSGAMGRAVAMPEWGSDDDYGLYQFWLLMDKESQGSGKSLNDLCYAAIRGMVDGLNNPYNEFVGAKESHDRLIRLIGQVYAGLGFLFTADYHGKKIYIDDVFPGSPADKGGLKRFDEVLAVDGRRIVDMDMMKAPMMFRGRQGSTAVLLVARRGWDKPRQLKFVRGVLKDYKDAYCKMESGIPYCRLYGFGSKTVENLEESFAKLPKHGRQLILDLRNNPGGMIFTATKMLGRLWLKSRFSTVFIKRKYGAVPFNDSYPSALLDGYKTVVLVNGGTTSSSELVVGALKDYGKATLVGEKTFGKGVSQKTTVVYGSILSIVFAYFLTPMGHVIDKNGIEPNVRVPFTLEDLKAGRDPQLETAKKILKK